MYVIVHACPGDDASIAPAGDVCSTDFSVPIDRRYASTDPAASSSGIESRYRQK